MATKVRQSIIDELRKSGMAAALKKVESGEATEEFTEAVRRFYPKVAPKKETAGIQKRNDALIKNELQNGKSESKSTSESTSTSRYIGDTAISKPIGKNADRIARNRAKGKAKTDARLAALEAFKNNKTNPSKKRMDAAKEQDRILAARRKLQEKRDKRETVKVRNRNLTLIPKK